MSIKTDLKIYESFLEGDISLSEFENYLKLDCDYGNIPGYNRDMWSLIDEVMGVSSLHGVEIEQSYIAAIKERAIATYILIGCR